MCRLFICQTFEHGMYSILPPQSQTLKLNLWKSNFLIKEQLKLIFLLNILATPHIKIRIHHSKVHEEIFRYSATRSTHDRTLFRLPRFCWVIAFVSFQINPLKVDLSFTINRNHVVIPWSPCSTWSHRALWILQDSTINHQNLLWKLTGTQERFCLWWIDLKAAPTIQFQLPRDNQSVNILFESFQVKFS